MPRLSEHDLFRKPVPTFRDRSKFLGRQWSQYQQSTASRRSSRRETTYPLQVRKMPVPKASRRAQSFHRSRPDPRALRPDLRAPARRLGRQRHQDRAAAGTRRQASRRAARATGRTSRTCIATSASMTLNLKAPEGCAAFKRMVKKADVVVENFRPDVKKRLGIDYEDAQEGQSAHRLRQHLRLRPGRALCRPARASTRSRRAWAG